MRSTKRWRLTTSGAFAPLLGCVVGTSQLGDPVGSETSTGASSSSSASATVADDDGATGMAPATDTGAATESPTSGDESASSQPTTAGEAGTMTSSAGTGPCDGTGEPCEDTEGVVGCSTFMQDCVAGQKCTMFADDGGLAWNNTRCIDIAPQPLQAGDFCVVEDYPTSGLDECDIGLFCWPEESGDDGPWTGHCIPMCGGTEDDPTCPITFGCESVWCWESCDPLASTCDEAYSCGFVSDDLLCLPAWDGGLGFGESCTMAGECAYGLACIPGENHPAGCDSYACCAQACDLQGTACAEGECTPFGEDFTTVGACMVPA